ncbi:hypothetical protein Trydic_g3202 [Trypoxylus dichotomus]
MQVCRNDDLRTRGLPDNERWKAIWRSPGYKCTVPCITSEIPPLARLCGKDVASWGSGMGGEWGKGINRGVVRTPQTNVEYSNLQLFDLNTLLKLENWRDYMWLLQGIKGLLHIAREIFKGTE